jgi:hypothetical protein
MTDWTCALQLDSTRAVTAGSEAALCDAVRRGADLRIYTEFRHNEHIDLDSPNDEVVREVAEFRETILVQDRWAGGIMTLRQPVDIPDGFGPRPSMSFFLYNQDGRQAIARPHLDGVPAVGDKGPSPLTSYTNMPKYHQQDGWDSATNAPSHNFIYDFDVFKYWVRDDWREVLSHSDDGEVVSGSLAALADAFSEGAEVKVAIRGLCDGLAGEDESAIEHEVFIQVGSSYYYTKSRLYVGATHPLVRVTPAIPLRYASGGWDFGWAMCRTDGFVALRLADPYSLKMRESDGRYALRWFVR